MKFYEDQHKLAAYLERTGAEFEYCARDWYPGSDGHFKRPIDAMATGYAIRPVLRYGLPSHLQSEIANPDDLTEEQICEGGKYRCAIASENDGRFGTFKFNQCQIWDKDSNSWKPTLTEMLVGKTIRLPATVPWPDWEAGQATPWPKWYTPENEKPAPKDARTAELEKQAADIGCHYCNRLLDASIVPGIYECPRCIEQFKNAPLGGNTTSSMVTRINQLEDQLAASPWRPMTEVPTEQEWTDSDGSVFAKFPGNANTLLYRNTFKDAAKAKHCIAWMPVPKFQGWPDPLADLLKSHGVAVTPEILAALNAWKGVEK